MVDCNIGLASGPPHRDKELVETGPAFRSRRRSPGKDRAALPQESFAISSPFQRRVRYRRPATSKVTLWTFPLAPHNRAEGPVAAELRHIASLRPADLRRPLHLLRR